MSGSGELRISLLGLVIITLVQFVPGEFYLHPTTPMILPLFGNSLCTTETYFTVYTGHTLYSFWHKEDQLMPWNESTKIDEKLRFVSRFPDGEKIFRLC